MSEIIKTSKEVSRKSSGCLISGRLGWVYFKVRYVVHIGHWMLDVSDLGRHICHLALKFTAIWSTLSSLMPVSMGQQYSNSSNLPMVLTIQT